MDKNHLYCTKMLRYYGFLTRSDVTERFVGQDQKKDIGRADIFAARNGLAVNVEVKRGISGFDLSNWRSNQRSWGVWSSQPPFNVPYYIFLTIGKHPAHYSPSSYMPKRTWLIPLNKMIEVCNTIEPIQKTLPYKTKGGMKREMQDNQYDAITVLQEYELEWNKDNSLERPEWLLNVDHIEEMIQNGKTQKEIDKYYRIGGFWTVPKSNTFYEKFIA